MATRNIEDHIGLEAAVQELAGQADGALTERPEQILVVRKEIEALIQRLYDQLLPVRTRPSSGGDPEPHPDAGRLQQAIATLSDRSQRLYDASLKRR